MYEIKPKSLRFVLERSVAYRYIKATSIAEVLLCPSGLFLWNIISVKGQFHRLWAGECSSFPGLPPGGGGGTAGLPLGPHRRPACTSGLSFTKSSFILITVVKKSLNIKFFSPAIFMNCILKIPKLLFALLLFTFTGVISVGTVSIVPGPTSQSHVTKSSAIFSSCRVSQWPWTSVNKLRSVRSEVLYTLDSQSQIFAQAQ